MTVNRQPRGLLFRIKKASNCICDLDPHVRRYIEEQLQLKGQRTEYLIDDSPGLLQAVIAAVRHASDRPTY